MSTASTRLVALLGYPVAHSRSPAMHTAALEALGIDAAYLAFAVPPEALADAVTGLRRLGAVGANVTVPHKQAVMAHLDLVEPAARAIGAVNTLVRDGGRLVGANTDAPGLVRSLEDAGVAIAGQRVLVLGAGGAARAAVVGLAEAGARRVVVAARELARAQGLMRQTGAADAAIAIGASLHDAMGQTDLLVQATSATLGGGAGAEAFAASLPLEAMPPDAAVIDLVYAPRETAVLRAAAARQLRCVDGLGMLAWQAALAFERWFDLAPPIEAMRDALGE